MYLNVVATSNCSQGFQMHSLPCLYLAHGSSATSISHTGTSPQKHYEDTDTCDILPLALGAGSLPCPTSVLFFILSTPLCPHLLASKYIKYLGIHLTRPLASGFLWHLADGYNQQEVEGQEKSQVGAFIPAALS